MLEVNAPGSKAYTERALICASLADGISEIEGALFCDDTRVIAQALKPFGAQILKKTRSYLVRGNAGRPRPYWGELDMDDCGFGMRAMIAYSTLPNGNQKVTLTGSESLCKRPVAHLVETLSDLGANVAYLRNHGHPPTITRDTHLIGGEAKIDSSLSSQFESAILLVEPYAEREIRMKRKGVPASRPYIDITEHVRQDFGYRRFGDKYNPTDCRVEGDWSNAAFLLVWAALRRVGLRVYNINPESLQGDKVIMALLKSTGVEARVGKDYAEVTDVPEKLAPIDYDARDTPDLVMPLLLLAGAANGTSRITGTGNLRIKEMDRVEGASDILQACNVVVKASEDQMEVYGLGSSQRLLTSAQNVKMIDGKEHRKIMMAAVAGVPRSNIENSHKIGKSYPNFWKDLERLERASGFIGSS